MRNFLPFFIILSTSLFFVDISQSRNTGHLSYEFNGCIDTSDFEEDQNWNEYENEEENNDDNLINTASKNYCDARKFHLCQGVANHHGHLRVRASTQGPTFNEVTFSTTKRFYGASRGHALVTRSLTVQSPSTLVEMSTQTLQTNTPFSLRKATIVQSTGINGHLTSRHCTFNANLNMSTRKIFLQNPRTLCAHMRAPPHHTNTAVPQNTHANENMLFDDSQDKVVPEGTSTIQSKATCGKIVKIS